LLHLLTCTLLLKYSNIQEPTQKFRLTYIRKLVIDITEIVDVQVSLII